MPAISIVPRTHSLDIAKSAEARASTSCVSLVSPNANLSLDLQTLELVLGEIVENMAAQTDRGRVADYIPELARVDPTLFGIAVALPTGQTISAGDAQIPFSIQSISKVFTLAMALGRFGDELWSRVGLEPSGLAFNSILQLEQGVPATHSSMLAR